MKRTSFCIIALTALIAVGCSKDTITQVSDTTSTDVSDVEFSRTVTVVYSSSTASVSGTGDGLTVTVDGAGVTIVNSGSEAVAYNVSGTSSNGYLKIYSSAVQQLCLNGLNLANPSGAAINLQGSASKPSGGERTYLVIGGTNTLADGSSYSATPDDEDEKGVVFAEGDIVVSGDGSLTVTASGKSGIVSDDCLYIKGGDITVNMTSAAKVVSGDTLKPACMKGKDFFSITDGTLTLTSSGTGAKGISGDGTATFAGGTVTVTVTGTNFGTSGGGWGGGSASGNSVAAKGIKFDGNITISGGVINVTASKHEGIETKGTMEITGGQVYSYSASDDAINSASTMTIEGGYICGHSAGNDGLDANGNLYIKGGLVYAIGASSPEVALDANTEGGYKLYVQGGTLIAIGGLEGGASLSQSCYQTSSWTRSAWYAITVGSDTYAFKTPASGGSGLVVSGSSQPTLKSGVTVSGGTTILGGMILLDGTVSGGTAVSLSSYSGGNGGGNGGGGGGGGGGHGGGPH